MRKSHSTSVAGLCALVALGLGVGGCEDELAGDPPDRRASGGQSRTLRDETQRRGYTIAVPVGWHRAEASLTPTLVDPREILSIATYPLRSGDGFCESLERVPPADAFVTVQERGRGAYGQEGFPPRPASFEPDPELPGMSTWPYCAHGDDKPPIPMLDYWFGFSDAGRAFHVFVGVGKAAPPRVRREAFALLNSLRFDPAAQPDWESAG